MVNLNRILVRVILLCIILSTGSGLSQAQEEVIETTADQSTQMDTINTTWSNDQDIPTTYSQVAENNQFNLYVDQNSLGFIVEDNRSHYVWHSNLDQVIDGDRLNKSWKAFAQSGISIDYLDKKAVSKRISVINSNHTLVIKPIDQGVVATLSFIDFKITIQVSILLEATGVRIDIPFSTIKQESQDYKLGTIYVFPFLGATREDSVPGYMFIPDGSGALIRFNKQTKATNMFYGKYYGADLGMITSIPYDRSINPPNRISLPVTGMVHGYHQNAFINIVESGAAYGEIEAHPSGIITNFNFLYNAFTYNESYFQATNRSGDGVTILQHNPNQFDIRMHYRFLTQGDSDYVGMAKSYQQYLVENGILKKLPLQEKNISIRLEFLGGEKDKVLLWNRMIPMTTVGQMENILQDIGINHVDVVYYGWQPYGASNMPPKVLNLDKALGNASQLRKLADDLTAKGGHFYLYLDPQAAYKGVGGYSPRNDLAMSITDANLQGYNRGKVNYYFNFSTLNRRLDSFINSVGAQTNINMALDGVGSILYSDFKNNQFINREESIKKYQQLIAKMGSKNAFYLPNDYMFGLTQSYLDIPLSNNGYIYTTDSVPFLQIVLAGYIPYFGPALNFSSDIQADLLRQADFGIYPSYFLTNEVTANILNTRSDWIFTSSYDQWSAEIKKDYQWLNALLSPVAGQEMISRQVLKNGVIAITYSNHKQIIVNYTESPYTQGSLSVKARDAVITEAAP